MNFFRKTARLKSLAVKLRLVLVSGLFVLLPGCFDYSESIFFAPDLGGSLEISYTVPLRKSDDSSLISYFHLDKSEIEKKYKGDLGREVEITEFKKVVFDDAEGAFKRKATVSYKVQFRQPGELEKILIGKTRVFYNEGKWVIQRTFSSAQALPDGAGRASKALHETLRALLARHSLSFLIVYPERYDLFTNQGAIVRPGVQSMNFPLTGTLDRGGIVWTMEIKTNPLPQVSRGR